MKKIFALAGLLLALGMGSAFAKKASDENKVKVVTTIFPEYDWVKEIVGEKADDVELTLLLNNGVDLHSYQPSVKDIAKIQEADIFVYVGGESDEWVEDVLKNVKSPNQKVINLLEVLGDRVKAEEVVEGMEHEHHHGHDHDDHDGDHDEHGHEHDAHDGHHNDHDEHGHDHDEHEHEHHDSHAHSHASEIHADDIKDRSLSEFNGEWQSLYPILVSGKLEEYVEHQAEEKGKSEKEMQKEIEAKWNCGAKLVKIDGNKITLTYDNGKSVSGTYKYAGYAVKKNDEGKITNVRYKFETKDKNAPKYVMFNDHGFEPAKEVAHFHFYFGNNNFEEFMNSKVNSYFVGSKLSAHECEDLLLGRNHDEHGHDEHGHDHDEHEHHPDHEDEELDEHVWLSLRFAKVLCGAICDALCQADSKNAEVYKKNLASYTGKLDTLDAKYSEVVKSASKNTLLFGDRFPFRYMVDDYGLKYYAAFTGCSAESEASFKTIAFLSEKVNELGLNSVCQIESGNGKIAKTVISNSKNKKAKVLTLDSLQSTRAKQIKKGATYLGAMEKNLEVLKEALR